MSPPKSINKSKISTTFNKDFIPTKLKKVPKQYAAYLPTDLPNNGSPRTAYDRRGLLKHFISQSPRRRHDPPPRSPMTRKPVNPNRWWDFLYTNKELEASKHKKSHRYKIIQHMTSTAIEKINQRRWLVRPHLLSHIELPLQKRIRDHGPT